MQTKIRVIKNMAICSAVAGAGLLARSQYECSHFQTITYTVRSARLPSEFDGFTLAFLTDLHNHSYGPENERLVEAIQERKPDLILVGGDMVVAKGVHSLRVPLHLMKELTGNFPVYYGLGNHEQRMDAERDVYGDQFDVYEKALERMGVRFLRDQSEYVERNGAKIKITGLDLKREFYQKARKYPMKESVLKDTLGEGHCPEFHILLAHSPLYFDEYARWGADLVLAGHFHGGTIRLPVIGGVITPNYIIFPKYDRGRYENGVCTMILSSGLGTHSINIRLNNRPQLIFIRLKKPEREK